MRVSAGSSSGGSWYWSNPINASFGKLAITPLYPRLAFPLRASGSHGSKGLAKRS